ncbi:hypothetical protein IAE19_06835 [Acinetobacter sp. S40]|uniref:hypothetical protein n=1 Tax=unclassified Acinetobacter TaxID=196816 RepID=UPI00190BE261|nr:MULTISPECIES: hypothetical protein [unclassified Acinetobacter]MBJ9985159.1 hypothetical protein [Acinetobacter sp. S40]MBK0063354.1 hypothetical protein [Acinetobacter sp. S55]MBK0066734.1 hypothetical protein [Acinetobacter sp. S54]
MKLKLALAALVIVPLTLTACAKKNDAPASQEGQAAPAQEKITPEQQAAIDALDKPVMDEKNTDISESVANAPAEPATPATEAEAAAVEPKQDKVH